MRYSTVLFDVDGVMLGEDTYFNATSQTVHEIITTNRFFGKSEAEPDPSSERLAEIRSQVLGTHDEVLDFLKGRGVNSNWDMVYLLVSHSLLKSLAQDDDRTWVRGLLMRGLTLDDAVAVQEKVRVQLHCADFTKDFPEHLQKHEFLQYLNTLALQWLDVDTDHFGRKSDLWEQTRSVFQEFYLGTTEKPGYLHREEPIATAEELQAMLSTLQEKGVVLGIATGRPQTETLIPLEALGVLKYIPLERIATASTVLEAEAHNPALAPLAKPHPFSYLRALRGAEGTHAELLLETLPLDRKDVLVVGDSLADLLAAQALGTSFAATLTGHEGERAREMFEKHGADHILKDVREVAGLF